MASQPLATTQADGFLQRVASILSVATEIGALQPFLEEVSKVLPGRCWVAAWDPDRGTAAWSPAPWTEPFPVRLAAQESSVLGLVLNRGRSVLIPDARVAAKSAERSYLARAGGAWAFLPLKAAGQTVGCLVLHPSSGSLDDETMETVRSALPIVALFLKNNLLQRELEARVEERTVEISLLYDISRSLAYVLSPQDLFHLVGTSLRRALQIDMSSLMLLLPDHREIALQLSAPAEDRAIRWLYRLAVAEVEKLGAPKPSRLPMTVGHSRPSGGEPPIRSADMNSAVHAPLHIRGQVAGLLSVASREPDAFGESQIRLLYTIANQASLTLDRIRTVREAETNRMRSMLESMAEGVMLLDDGLRVIMSNPAARACVAAIQGRRASRVPRSLPKLGDVRLGPLLESFGPPDAKSHTVEVPASDGKVFSITCSPVRGLGGDVQGMVVVVSDITEARVLQLQFAQSERLSALGEMISGVAHELNNPLASVIGFSQLIQNRDVDTGVKKKLEAIDREATRCQKIVQNLVRFARPQSPERRPLDVNYVLESVLQLVDHQLSADRISVAFRRAADLRAVIGDFHLLQQVFFNVIHNAHQAMKEKGGPGTLVVTTRNDGAQVVTEITDDGPGITPRNLKRIFDPFFSTKEVGKGTGLGLSIAYGTVREHAGTIRAKSRPGTGTTFIVSLPVAAAGTLPEIAAPAPPPTAQREPAEAVAVAAPGRRILVVEDEASLAEVVAEVLQTQGHRVDTAGDGRTAKSMISRARYDLIISDLKMPNMNGRDFYRHVAAVEPDLARRIIFSTGDTASPDTQAFFEEVGNPFLTKPFNLNELLRVVDLVLGQS